MITPLPSSDAEPVVQVEEFDALLAKAQPRLRGYILSILGGWSDVEDLVQETNLVLLRKRETFEPGSNFIAWAFRVAYFKATTWRRDRRRENRLVFGDGLFHEMAELAEQRFTTREPPTAALKTCLKQLSPREQELIHLKYVEGRSLVAHAEATGTSAHALHKAISRIRLALRHCVQKNTVLTLHDEGIE
ncbi:sigma-70 family RNA polymerase sigma factor [Luteolibacter arcticus]|uniref:Sigma-70 family RNA polymerase sigma factor n=1 Tax=Luteolibacter arcticus TaxID=1581411 RepID=A0ABT3GNE4_9BACT|nr:sigma-70 family RNA polymerase sigma factor [Luteolibacter arcticus]MCW1925022.1 sigma-70 family RNA polymerase sigma factor [Luteolibacter arcticus]